MVGVLLRFYKSDDRQKFFKIFPEKVKLRKYVNIKEPYFIWGQPKPIETLILLKTNSTLNFFSTTTNSANTLHFSINRDNHYWFYLYLRVNSTKLYAPLDFSYVPELKTTYLVASCYLTSYFVITHTAQRIIKSLSTAYSSFVWVERELVEFFDVFIFGLKDNRRLLTDYTVYTQDYSSYKTLSYDGLGQTVYFE